jgi:subfamily B ATP-binding cassette protein MsbA
MQHLKDSKESKKKPKVSILKAFKTIIWPKRKFGCAIKNSNVAR